MPTSFKNKRGVTHTGVANWSLAHNTGNAIDISGIVQQNADGTTHFVGIKNKDKQAQAYSDDNLIVKEFSRSLVTGGAGRVIQPWETYNTGLLESKKLNRYTTSDGFLNNAYVNRKIEINHWNHLHVSY